MPHISNNNNCLQRVKCSNVFQLSKHMCVCVCFYLLFSMLNAEPIFLLQFNFHFVWISENILKRWLFWSRQEAVFHRHSKSHFPEFFSLIFLIFALWIFPQSAEFHFNSFSSSVYLFWLFCWRTSQIRKVYTNALMIIIIIVMIFRWLFIVNASWIVRRTASNTIHLVWLSFSSIQPMLARGLSNYFFMRFHSGFFFSLYEKSFQFIYIILWTNIH